MRWKKIKNKDIYEKIYKYFTDNDFIKVVRCGNCIWSDNCKIRDYFWTDNDFCSKGMRRESDE